VAGGSGEIINNNIKQRSRGVTAALFQRRHGSNRSAIIGGISGSAKIIYWRRQSMKPAAETAGGGEMAAATGVGVLWRRK